MGKKGVFVHIIYLTILIALGYYISRDFFEYNKYIFIGDFTGIAAWTNYFIDSISKFHQIPTWSPIWMNGMPFFGLVPYGLYLICSVFLILLKDSFSAVYLLTGVFFILSGVFMYALMYKWTKSKLGAFIGSTIYLAAPVHAGSLLTMGMADMVICYAFLPLVVLLFNLYLDDGKGRYFILFSIFTSLLLLTQIEFAVLFLIFLLFPYAVYKLIVEKKYKVIINKDNLKPARYLAILFGIIVLSFPATFYINTIIQKSNFSFHHQQAIEEGLAMYSYANVNQVFTKAEYINDLYSKPYTEYYLGFLPYIFILFSIISLFFKSTNKIFSRKKVLLLLVLSVLCLTASFGSLDVLNYIKKIITPLAEMRVPFRFMYLYIFFFCALVGYGVLFIKNIFKNTNYKSAITIIIIILTTLSVYDYRNYFEYYRQDRHKVLRSDFSWGQDLNNYIQSISDKRDTLVYVQPFYHFWGEQFSSLGLSNSYQSSISWLDWDLNEDSKEFWQNNFNTDDYSNDKFSFDSTFAGIDYYAISYIDTVPNRALARRVVATDLDAKFRQSNNIEYLRTISNKYYEIIVYKNTDPSPKITFLPIKDLIIIPIDNTDPDYIYNQLYDNYINSKNRYDKPSDFLKSTIFISNQELSKIPQPPKNSKVINDFKVNNYLLDNRKINLDVSTSDEGIIALKYFYNPWWSLTVNGQSVEPIKIDGYLTGIPVGKGDSNIQLSYKSPYEEKQIKVLEVILIFGGLIFLPIAYNALRKKSQNNKEH